jgi:nucleoside-diphosphate-sugar epimerase
MAKSQRDGPGRLGKVGNVSTLVTGGAGFVASNIVKTLAQRGHEVVCFDLVPPDDLVKGYHSTHSSSITYVQGDILNPGDLERAAAGRNVTKIVHAAVFTGIRQDIERDRSRSIVDVNVTGTANLLGLAMTQSMERFLYVSSGSVYGEGLDPAGVLQEEIKLYPRTLYASTKHASELLTRRYGELHGFQTVSTRLSSPYGPMERVTGHRAVMSVLYEWTRDAVRGGPIRLGDRTASRDYTYVADTASAICSVLDAPSLSYGEYNVASGLAYTLEEIADAVKEVRPSVRIVDDPAYVVQSLRPDAARGPMDVTRLTEDVGFKPAYDLVSGIREYLEWREASGFRD